MRKVLPSDGSYRAIKRFAFKPMIIQKTRIWLEFYCVTQNYCYDSWHDSQVTLDPSDEWLKLDHEKQLKASQRKIKKAFDKALK
jgi:hypothetical protein